MTDTPAAPSQTSLDTLIASAVAAQPGGYGAGVSSTSITDESIGGSEYDSYKVVKGRKDRLTFLTPDNIVVARTHYVEGAGFLICMSEFKKQGNTEVMVRQAECCRRLDRSRKKCAGLVLQYATNNAGVLQNVEPLFSMKVWRFSERTFAQLRDMHAQWSLKSHDFSVVLDGDEKYQGVNLMPLQDSVAAHPKFLARYGQQVSEWVTSMMPQMERVVGRRIDAAKWAEILKTAPDAPSSVPAPAAADNAVQTLEDLLAAP